MFEVNEISKKILEMMYDRTYHYLKKNKRLKDNSVLISLMEMKSNKRLETLLETSIDKNIGFSDVIYQELIKEEYIISITLADTVKYILSGKGIWSVEKEKVGLEKLVTYLDKKFFGEYRKKASLSKREKVIILSFIALGAFSEQQVVDLKTNDLTKDKIKEVLNISLKFLQKHKIISKNFTEKELYGKLGNEHPVSHLIRHTDSLPKKTAGIYKVINPQKYYLKIYNIKDDVFDIDKLTYLYKLVFDDNLVEIKDEFIEFVENIYSEYSIYVFEKIIFSTVDMKDYLEDAFHEYVLKKDIL